MQYNNDDVIFIAALEFPEDKLLVIASLLSLSQSRVIQYVLLPETQLQQAGLLLVYRDRQQPLSRPLRRSLVTLDRPIITVVRKLPVPVQGPVIRWSAVNSHLLNLLDRVVQERLWQSPPLTPQAIVPPAETNNASNNNLTDQQQLQAENDRLRDFAELGSDWLWETDARLRLIYLSPAYETVSGLSLDQALGQTLPQLLTRLDEVPPGLPALLDDFANARSFADFEYFWTVPDTTPPQIKVLRISGKPLWDSKTDALCGYRGVGKDVTAEYNVNQRLSYQASHDALTGLVNRREFERRLQRVLAYAQTHSTDNALFYIDLDRFKPVNDRHGHAAGDALLRQLGELFRQRLRSRDTVARLGGDEFAVLIEHTALESALRLASGLLKAIKDFRFEYADELIGIGASVGIVIINANSKSAAAVLQAADSACYIAKNAGGNRIYINHDGSVELDRLRQDQRWALRIKQALSENRFRLDYQPIVSLGEGGDYIELFLRLIDEDGQAIRSREFWAVAERHGLAVRLDRWVVGNALAWLSDYQRAPQGLSLCFINLAAASVNDSRFLGFVIEQFDYYGVAPQQVCFEIKEQAIQANLARYTLFIKALKNLGCRFALGNFGHSRLSLTDLKQLPVDFLKIDRVFIRHITGDPVNYVMVKSLNNIGRAMGKNTIAEFVEDERTLDTLKEIGIGYAQGYFTGRPRSIERVPRRPP